MSTAGGSAGRDSIRYRVPARGRPASLIILARCSFVAFDVSRIGKAAMIPVLRLFGIVALAVVAQIGNAHAQNQVPTVNRTEVSKREIGAFSQSYTTHHELDLPDRKIKFTATAENL